MKKIGVTPFVLWTAVLRNKMKQSILHQKAQTTEKCDGLEIL